jgi:hypothetical protein
MIPKLERLLRLVLLVIMVPALGFMAHACATLKSPVPAGCEDSMIWKYAPWSHVILIGAVDGAYAMSGQNPELYRKIKVAAHQAQVLLTGAAPTYESLQNIPDLNLLLTSQLAAIFRPDQVIDPCDRDLLLSYLKMI